MSIIYNPAQQTPQLVDAFRDTEIASLFDLILPVLPGSQRFIFSHGVLCDKGTKVNFDIKKDSVIQQHPLTFYTTDIPQREIGEAIGQIYTKADGFGADEAGLKTKIMGSLVNRVSSPIALILVLLERTFDCHLLAVPEWKPVFRAILEGGLSTDEHLPTTSTPPSTHLIWLRRILPDHPRAVDAAFAASAMAYHASMQIAPETASAATPPRVRKIRKEVAINRLRRIQKIVS